MFETNIMSGQGTPLRDYFRVSKKQIPHRIIFESLKNIPTIEASTKPYKEQISDMDIDNGYPYRTMAIFKANIMHRYRQRISAYSELISDMDIRHGYQARTIDLFDADIRHG